MIISKIIQELGYLVVKQFIDKMNVGQLKRHHRLGSFQATKVFKQSQVRPNNNRAKAFINEIGMNDN